ncbi:T9SS type A sorting domain-containing protein [Polaribacter sp. BAL334]|uniref:T9SS type A sorting domain-containing protein n=1 Tax=Polaribacter sp. BAL334 TaxID=1708178 RepID=UPI0018D2137F|nr:T9SS type A sorting domain-containing protein [Polaribacter sp. BAL334]MBG7613311.1 T9SS type A sorting domain-containing protein [Polaribacter sp. BAL334]
MKKITLLFALLISSIGFSQQVVVEDFEGSPAIAGFEGLGSATIVDDPASGGTRGKTFQLITSSTGNGWQGAEVVLASGTVLELTTDKTIKVDIYSTTAFAVMAKLEGSGPAAANTQSHGGSGWETITFTFTTGSDGTATANGEYSKVVFFPNRKADDSGWNSPVVTVTMYADNITGVKKTTAPPSDPEPTDAPQTPPTFAAQNVMSLYSEAYTPSATISNVPWDDSVFEEVTIAGNKVLKITGGNFIGMDLDVFLDATAMTHLHMDYWISTDHTPGTVLNPKLSNHGGDKTKETSAIDITNIIESQDEVKKWQSKDFPLNAGARESIKQFLITDAAKVGVYYLDNVYMYVAGTAGVEDNLFNVSIYPNPASNRLNISAANTIQNAEIYNVLGKKVMNVTINKTSESIDISNLASGVYMIKYNIENNVGTAKFIKQ